MSLHDDRYIGQFRPEYSKVHRDRDLMWVVPFRVPLVLAVVGSRFSGVTTALNYLSERHSFDVYTLGGEVRREALERGISLHARRNLQLLGDRLRHESGDPAILARRVMRRIRSNRIDSPAMPLVPSVAIGGLKHVEELRQLQLIDTLHVAVIHCGDTEERCVRFDRIVSSGLLQSEYDAERARRKEKESLPAPWSELSNEAQRVFFDQLDAIHNDGHPTELDEALRAVPNAVVSQARDLVQDPDRRVHVVENSSDRLDEFRRSIDALLREVRPREQVMRHLSETEEA